MVYMIFIVLVEIVYILSLQVGSTISFNNKTNKKKHKLWSKIYIKVGHTL